MDTLYMMMSCSFLLLAGDYKSSFDSSEWTLGVTSKINCVVDSFCLLVIVT